MLNGELNVPLSQCYHNHRKYGHGGDHVDIYGKNHRCFTLKQDTIWSRRPWCRCWFSCTTTLLFYVIYQSFYIANQKLTWLILMKAFNILSNLLQLQQLASTVYLAIYLHLRYQELVTIPRTAFLFGILRLLEAFFVSTLIWAWSYPYMLHRWSSHFAWQLLSNVL